MDDKQKKKLIVTVKKSFSLSLPDINSMHFDIGKELSNLSKVWKVEAWEAVVFYSARILEKLIRTYISLRFKGSEEKSQLFSLLILMEQYHFLYRPYVFLSHILRRMGNSVRHAFESKTTRFDAELSIFIVLLFLDELTEVKHAYKGILSDSDSTKLFKNLMKSTTYDLLKVFSMKRIKLDKLYDYWKKRDNNAFSKTPALISLYVEFLIDAKQKAGKNYLEHALKVITTAKEELGFTNDLRINQLHGLALKNTGRLDSSIHLLEQLQKNNPNDPETTGILASAYRGRWLKKDTNQDLRKAYRLYRDYYKKSNIDSAYIGINYAATALYNNQPAVSRTIANDVIRKFDRRLEKLGLVVEDLHLWDIASYAEAQLLTGNFDAARKYYKAYLTRIRSKRGLKQSTLNQLNRNLQYFHILFDAHCFLKFTYPEDNSLLIGVTGHRTFSDVNRVVSCLSKVIHFVRTKNQNIKNYTIITPLAEGADRFVPQLFRKEEGIEVKVIVKLPLELSDYITDFKTKSSRKEFSKLLGTAGKISFPTHHPNHTLEREKAYQEVGESVVDQCDLLLAVWDGKKAQGKGGTGQIVGYASKINKNRIIINPEDGDIHYHLT